MFAEQNIPILLRARKMNCPEFLADSMADVEIEEPETFLVEEAM